MGNWRKDEEDVKKQAGSEAKAKAALEKVGREALAKLKKEDKRREGDKK